MCLLYIINIFSPLFGFLSLCTTVIVLLKHVKTHIHSVADNLLRHVL